ncbi:hypothetical protein UG55_100978 [Frankia sp. EI5c]|nr:hypothetical protein UG55_100978 [Frankia sp. EI5c]
MDQEPNNQDQGRRGIQLGEVIARRIRPYAVLNGYGVQVAIFGTWNDAHVWAHEKLRDADVILPLEVEDRTQRITRRITREACELIAWTIFTKVGGCEPMNEEADPSPRTLDEN